MPDDYRTRRDELRHQHDKLLWEGYAVHGEKHGLETALDLLLSLRKDAAIKQIKKKIAERMARADELIRLMDETRAEMRR
jgi:hypothetical protein